jgi:hypothetical protein
MNGRGRPATLLGGATALAIAAAVTGFAGPQAFASQQVSLTFRYTCDFPVIGSQSAPVEVDSNIPNSIAVGQSTAHYVVTASVTAPWELSLGLRADGVSTITGTVDGQAYVKAPQGNLTETVPFEIHEITLPAFSSFTGTATASAPAVTFSKPGKAEIIVGDLTLHLDPRDSNGNLTSLGEMTVPCEPNPGQNDVAVTFAITGAASPTSSSAATASSPSPSPSPSASAATSASTATPTAAPTPHASPADPGPPKGADAAWVIWLGSLAALVGIVTAAFRYGPRLWNR